MANKHTISDLYQMQSLPLKDKVRMTQRRIEEWYEHYDGQVYVSLSGGKDSVVLLHLVREIYPDVPAVFIDTTLEYPEVRKFVSTFDNVTFLKPKMNFVNVIKKYGYPLFSKEISECVFGARKYLTSILKSGMLDRATDRPTDRPTDRTVPVLLQQNYWNRSISEQSSKERDISITTKQTGYVECSARKVPRGVLREQATDSRISGKERTWKRRICPETGNHDGDTHE